MMQDRTKGTALLAMPAWVRVATLITALALLPLKVTASVVVAFILEMGQRVMFAGFENMQNLGTKIERIAKPIAKSIDAIWGSDLATCGGCGNMRDNLNAGMSMKDAIIERWFTAKEKGGKLSMDYTLQVVVEKCEDLEEACKKAKKGELLVVGGQPRPQQAKPAQTGIQTSGQFSKTVVQPT